jgi:hypothetical protein
LRLGPFGRAQPPEGYFSPEPAGRRRRIVKGTTKRVDVRSRTGCGSRLEQEEPMSRINARVASALGVLVALLLGGGAWWKY